MVKSPQYSFMKISKSGLMKILTSLERSESETFAIVVSKMMANNISMVTTTEITLTLRYSRTSIAKAMSALQKKKFMKKIVNGRYMINPEIMYQGKPEKFVILAKEWEAIK